MEIAGDSAVCESYYCCYIEFIDDPEFVASGQSEAVLMGGRYVDRLTRVDGGWKISRRVSVVDRTRSLGEPAYWSAPTAARFTRGRGDELDPANVAFAEIRSERDRFLLRSRALLRRGRVRGLATRLRLHATSAPRPAAGSSKVSGHGSNRHHIHVNGWVDGRLCAMSVQREGSLSRELCAPVLSARLVSYHLNYHCVNVTDGRLDDDG